VAPVRSVRHPVVPSGTYQLTPVASPVLAKMAAWMDEISSNNATATDLMQSAAMALGAERNY
jgi:hypothetical protein